MPKYWSFDLLDIVKVKEGVSGMEGCSGLEGYILDQLEVSQYDYEVVLENGTVGKFKESELIKIGEV